MTARIWLPPTRPDVEAEGIRMLLAQAGETIAESWGDPRVEAVSVAGRTVYAIEREDWTAEARCVQCGEVASGRGDGLSVIDAGQPGGLGPCGDHHSWRGVVGCGPIRIDHHSPGDPGHGILPCDFLPASSIGQVVAELARLELLPPDWPRCTEEHDCSVAEPMPGEISLGPPPIDGKCNISRAWVWVICTPASRAVQIPNDIVLCAAADHCLAAAYRGECPGVDPDALMRWRVELRAAFQARSVEEVMADIERARAMLRAAPSIPLFRGGAYTEQCDGLPASRSAGAYVRDMRPGRGAPCGYHRHPGAPWPACTGAGHDCWSDVPELPEAAVREQIAWIGSPRPSERDPRRKIVLQCASPEHLAAWPAWAAWPASQGLVDLYAGDPARGFAGGYLPSPSDA